MYSIRRWLAIVCSSLIILLSLSLLVVSGAQGAPDLDSSEIGDTQAVYDTGGESGVIDAESPPNLSCDHDCDRDLDSSPTVDKQCTDDRANTDCVSSIEQLDLDRQQNETERGSEANPEATPEAEEPDQLYDQLGDLDVYAYEFTTTDEGNPILLVEVEWSGRSPESTTITQLPGANADRIAISRNRLAPDERLVLRVDLVADDAPAILYTDQSLQRERAIVLSPDRGSSRETTLIRGTAIGVLTGILGVALAIYRHRNVGDSPEEGW